MPRCVILLGDQHFVADLPAIPDEGNGISFNTNRKDIPSGKLYVQEVSYRVDRPEDGMQAWADATIVVRCRPYKKGDDELALKLKNKRV